jgi:DNA-binding IclR family transcriptional regulator
VLRALATAPRSCNRQIAKTAGITRNSTPRVLRRLQADGLVRNVTGTTGQGQPNIWMLTVRGEEAISGTGQARDQASRAA